MQILLVKLNNRISLQFYINQEACLESFHNIHICAVTLVSDASPSQGTPAGHFVHRHLAEEKQYGAMLVP